MTVDGHDFLIRARAEEPDGYDVRWRTGPADYGFTAARSDRSSMNTAEAAESIRSFLAQIDPTTGYIE